MTFTAGSVLTAAQMNTHVRDNMKAAMGVDKASCRVFNSANQTIATATITTLTFDSERWDSQAMHSTVSNTSRVTIPASWGGQYHIGAHVAWAVGPSTTRGVFIFLNATYHITGTAHPADTVLNASTSTSTLYGVVAGDYVEVQVYQATGANLNTLSGSSLLSPEFWAQWQGTG